MNPLFLSLIIASVATLVVTLTAVPLAHRLARTRFPGKFALETVLTLPLVLPPTVVGYFIIATLGGTGWPGRWLKATFEYSIIFRIEGAILAAAIVAFPLLYLPAKAAFAGVDREHEETAALMGAGRRQIFWHVSLPMAARGIAGGLVLTFARALGEFGATVMVFGWRPGRLTMPISIFAAYEQNEPRDARTVVLVLTAICFGLIILFNRAGSRTNL